MNETVHFPTLSTVAVLTEHCKLPGILAAMRLCEFKQFLDTVVVLRVFAFPEHGKNGLLCCCIRFSIRFVQWESVNWNLLHRRQLPQIATEDYIETSVWPWIPPLYWISMRIGMARATFVAQEGIQHAQ